MSQDYSTEDRALLTALAAQAAPALRIVQLVREPHAQAQEKRPPRRRTRRADGCMTSVHADAGCVPAPDP
jgi:hypothetical protein